MIYFVQSGTDGPIKIGYSSRVKGRLSNMQVMSPISLTLLGISSGKRRDELNLHRQFASHRIRGEWFSPVADLLAHIASMPRVEDAAESAAGLVPVTFKISEEDYDTLSMEAESMGITVSGYVRDIVLARPKRTKSPRHPMPSSD